MSEKAPPEIGPDEGIYDAIPVSVLFFDLAEGGYRLSGANREAERAFSLRAADLVGKEPRELEPYLGPSIARGLAGFASGAEASWVEFEGFKESEGRERCFLVRASALGRGKERLVASCVDISDRKDMERVLRYSLAQVQSSNQELEEFAYAASHDLKEPLRVVSSFLDLLEKNYGPLLAGKGLEWIERTKLAAARMQAMIEGLMELSRVTTREAAMKPFPAERALDKALDSLRVLIEERGARISREALPILYGDEVQMARLFQNLVENAIKYAKPGQAPEVRIGAERAGGSWLIRVADGGIGIKAAYLDRIFEPFRRLHSREEYPGTGLGLATCRKIAEKHCGSIRAESEPGKGSAFILELPLGYAQ